jgi:predicted RNA-binding Zn-ribbon protein involved in translation (DUF1610 family)
MESINEKKKEETCESCGKAILDPEVECPNCGRFPHKAYHERSASKILGIAKFTQTSDALQPNQKLSEDTRYLNNLIHFKDF